MTSRYSAMPPVELPLDPKDAAEVVVGLGEVGLEPDRLAVFRDGVVELPLIIQCVTEVVVGHSDSRASDGLPCGIL